MDLLLTLCWRLKTQGRSTTQSSTQTLTFWFSDRVSRTFWREYEEESDGADSIMGSIYKSQFVLRHTQTEIWFKPLL